MKTRPGYRDSTRSLSVSLVLHVLILLLLTLLWKQPSVHIPEEWINADLMAVPDDNRPTLRRSRMRQIRESSTEPTSASNQMPQPIPRLSQQGVTTTHVPEFGYEDGAVLTHIAREERLSGPDTRAIVRRGNQGQEFRKSPKLLTERGQGQEASLRMDGNQTRPDAVGDAMLSIADALTRDAVGGKLDVVFLLDASGSMDPHIAAVARHLSEMAESIASRDVDAHFGVAAFRRIGREDILQTWELTQQLDELRQAMRFLRCEGDERALDVILQMLNEYVMREVSLKSFVLVTDERLTGQTSLSNAIQASQQQKLRINVLGIRDSEHQQLAAETDGLWFLLPEEYDLPEIGR